MNCIFYPDSSSVRTGHNTLLTPTAQPTVNIPRDEEDVSPQHCLEEIAPNV